MQFRSLLYDWEMCEFVDIFNPETWLADKNQLFPCLQNTLQRLSRLILLKMYKAYYRSSILETTLKQHWNNLDI